MSVATVTIRFEGRPVRCRADATVAAALWEHGVKVLSHSPKYGRPRGLLCARGHCMNCLMRVDGVPNVRTCREPVREGLEVARQDGGAFYAAPMHKALDGVGHLFPVGFYYKWFTRPSLVSDLFLKGLRPMTGIGRLPDAAAWSAPASPAPRDLGRVETLVLGAGPAGMAAALAAGPGTVLVDDHAAAGGQRRGPLDLVAERTPDVLDALPALSEARARLTDLAARVERAPGVEFRGGTRAVGAWQPDLLLLRDDDGPLQVRARRIVWAAGALDALPVFDDADAPGVLGPRALMRLLVRDGLDVRGQRAVVWGGGPDLWLAAALLHAAGATPAVALAPDAPADPAGLAAAQALGWTLHTGVRPERVRREDGALAALEFTAGDGGALKIPAALAVLCARGKPAYDVPYQLGCDLVLDPARGGYVPRDARDGRAEHTGPGGLRLTVTGEACGLAPEDVPLEVTA